MRPRCDRWPNPLVDASVTNIRCLRLFHGKHPNFAKKAAAAVAKKVPGAGLRVGLHENLNARAPTAAALGLQRILTVGLRRQRERCRVWLSRRRQLERSGAAQQPQHRQHDSLDVADAGIWHDGFWLRSAHVSHRARDGVPARLHREAKRRLRRLGSTFNSTSRCSTNIFQSSDVGTLMALWRLGQNPVAANHRRQSGTHASCFAHRIGQLEWLW